jgi:tetratricopeptide (TPR) repeat protein
MDDAAQAEVEKWVQSNQALKPEERAASQSDLDRRIKEKLEPVGQAYGEFLTRHPRDVRARLGYGNFLEARGDEPGAQTQWERVLEIDPKNADAHHNLACRYTETGQVKKSFEFFSKAIELNPADPVYYYNFANTLYVLRSQAAAYYQLTEQDVYAKVLSLYSNSVRLDPTNLTYATDLAQTYYAMRPFRGEEALKAWTNTLARARSPLEREEVHVHLARAQMLAGRLDEARAQLNQVTNASLSGLKSNLIRAIEMREANGESSKAVPRR